MSTISEQHRSALWTQIWYSKNGYYDCLAPDVRVRLDELHLSLLDQERAKVFGKPLPPADTTNIPKPVETPVPAPASSAVHDPALYSFDQRKLWIPWAVEVTSGVRRGRRLRRYPDGALVHWTAGHRNGLESGADFQKSSGMSYCLIDKDGNFGQGDPLDHWGYHGGASAYKGLSGTVSDELVGIELQAAGNLRESGGKFYPWWDEGKRLAKNEIPASEVVSSERRGNIAPGHYHAYTQAQMLTLRKGLCWLHLNYPSVFQIQFILGHDEVSPGRKTDPGAALVDLNNNPITMSQLRDWIADDVRQILANR
jgi:hypothetical protein